LVNAADLLGQLAADPGRAAVLLDVDGTLAPIVSRPQDAAVPEETRRELRRLSGRYALLAFVSGRAGDDAERVVGLPGLTYVGEHGLELDPEAARWAHALGEFADSVDWPPERKRLSVSFHWRTAEDPEAAEAYLTDVATRAAASGFRARFGRKVLEIRPPVDTNKGTAVRTLLQQHNLRRALYAGDDATDLDAFRGLDGLELAIRVAISSAEGPPELAAAADLVLAGPDALLELPRKL